MFRKIGYKQTIPDVGWVSEIIIERFDAAFELLSNNAVVYGGAVRDALAGMTLEGDLDISIPPTEFGGVHQAFNKSTRWKAVSNGQRPPSKSKGAYGKRRIPVINSIVEFEGINGARAQLICSNDNKSSPNEAALYIPRNVDIICCGVVIDINGIVYEVVDGAYDDCKKGILRLNEEMENPHLESLKERAAKLESRGWVNQLDMKKAAKLERKKKIKSPRLKKKVAKKDKHAGGYTSGGTVKITGSLDAGEPASGWFAPDDKVQYATAITGTTTGRIKSSDGGAGYMEANEQPMTEPDEAPRSPEESLRKYRKNRDIAFAKNVGTFKRR